MPITVAVKPQGGRIDGIGIAGSVLARSELYTSRQSSIRGALPSAACLPPVDGASLPGMPWKFILIGMAIGVVAEIVARVLRLWLFRHPLLVLFNIVVVYGLIMGGLASRLRPLGVLSVFAAAVIIGLAYELANLQFLHFWRFPDERGDGSAARAAMVVVISLLWGVVPLATAQAELSLRRMHLFGPPPSKIEALNERERLLIERREALQLRLRDVENRLRAVEKRRKRLQPNREPRQPGVIGDE